MERSSRRRLWVPKKRKGFELLRFLAAFVAMALKKYRYVNMNDLRLLSPLSDTRIDRFETVCFRVSCAHRLSLTTNNPTVAVLREYHCRFTNVIAESSCRFQPSSFKKEDRSESIRKWTTTINSQTYPLFDSRAKSACAYSLTFY